MRLKKEIGFSLVFKLTALILLWWLCFSKPIAPDLSPADIQQHILGERALITGETDADNTATR